MNIFIKGKSYFIICWSQSPYLGLLIFQFTCSTGYLLYTRLCITILLPCHRIGFYIWMQSKLYIQYMDLNQKVIIIW